MPEYEPYEMKMSQIAWDPAGYMLDGSDYIFSMLLEMPEMYYIVPSRKIVFVYIIGRGMVKLHHDFTVLSDEEAGLFIYHLRRHFEVR